jgi:hypothetical protein
MAVCTLNPGFLWIEAMHQHIRLTVCNFDKINIVFSIMLCCIIFIILLSTNTIYVQMNYAINF